jgi:hypothetical protein
MANITKSPSVTNYKNVSSSKVKSVRSSQIINHIYGKGEVHNNPDHRSGNERFILDTFYSNAHNLKASFIRLSNNEHDSDALKQYYRSHEEEVMKGASTLLEAITSILESSRSCDRSYGTHFTFLVESIINDFDEALDTIGIINHNYVFSINRKVFFETICEFPEHFVFLFKVPDGFIEMLSRVHYKIQNITDVTLKEGRIIDYRT